MVLLMPSLLLIATLLALVALQRWRPAFKSYWFVAAAGVLVAALVTLGLRFALPQQANFPGWHLGAGVQFPLPFVLDAFSWPLALALLSLLLAHLLGSVRRASGVSWPIWVPSLALAAAAVLAISAGDLLAVALSLFLLDILLYALHSSVAHNEGHTSLLEQFALNIGSLLLVLAAWATPPAFASLAAAFLAVAAALRLFVAAGPRVATRQAMPAFAGMLRAAPVAATIVLLRYMPPLAGIVLHLAVLLALLVALLNAVRSMRPSAAAHTSQQGLAALALASAFGGASGAALAFGLIYLFADSLAPLAARTPAARRPLMAAGALLLSGVWFTASQGASSQYAVAASPLLFLALPVHAMLLLGILQRSAAPAEPPAPDEPWTLAVENIGAALPAAMLLVIGVLLPAPYGGNSAPLWPGLVVAVLLAALWAARRQVQVSGRSLLPPHLRLPRWQLPAPRRVTALLSAGLAGGLRLLNSLLEGEAGLLWALLVIALLVSVFAQGGLAG